MKLHLENLKRSKLYSEELGIDLSSKKDGEIFKWFLASVLFGARISEEIAERTYRSFERHSLLTPGRILDAGWDFLVNPVMREGGYVRYDEKTSREILNNCEMLLRHYKGSLNHLHEQAKNPRDLERHLLEFYGVGPVTVNIFLRELRPFWEKADPESLGIVPELARKYNINLLRLNRKSIQFARAEAGLIRQRRVLKIRAGSQRKGGKLRMRSGSASKE